MSGRWIEVTRLTFRGERFRDHALELGALPELSQFQRIVSETAKSSWRAANPGKNLPRRFEERNRLYLRRVEEGSAVAPLEVYLEEPEAPELWQREPEEVMQAIRTAKTVWEAAERDEPFPEGIPRELLDEYVKFGQGLGGDESIGIGVTDENGQSSESRVTPATRERIARVIESPTEAELDVTGEVLEADIRQRRFQLWLDDKNRVYVDFSEEDERRILGAMIEHQTCRLRVTGKGQISPQGKPLRISHPRIKVIKQGERTFDPTARPIEDELAEIASGVPDEAWNRLPADLTDHLDHYLYGTPKG